jgi:hypothetical protein
MQDMDKNSSGDIDVEEFIRELRDAVREGGYDPNVIAGEKAKARWKMEEISKLRNTKGTGHKAGISSSRGPGNYSEQGGGQGRREVDGAGQRAKGRGNTPGGKGGGRPTDGHEGRPSSGEAGSSKGGRSGAGRRGGGSKGGSNSKRTIKMPRTGTTSASPQEDRHLNLECEHCRGRFHPEIFNCTCAGRPESPQTTVDTRAVLYAADEPGECRCAEDPEVLAARVAAGGGGGAKELADTKGREERQAAKQRARVLAEERFARRGKALQRQCTCFALGQNRWRAHLTHLPTCPFDDTTLRPSISVGTLKGTVGALGGSLAGGSSRVLGATATRAAGGLNVSGSVSATNLRARSPDGMRGLGYTSSGRSLPNLQILHGPPSPAEGGWGGSRGGASTMKKSRSRLRTGFSSPGESADGSPGSQRCSVSPGGSGGGGQRSRTPSRSSRRFRGCERERSLMGGVRGGGGGDVSGRRFGQQHGGGRRGITLGISSGAVVALGQTMVEVEDAALLRQMVSGGGGRPYSSDGRIRPSSSRGERRGGRRGERKSSRSAASRGGGGGMRSMVAAW